jgi:HD-GYP domain-containing protein (c-di-GMP phosphodiesterase class II)
MPRPGNALPLSLIPVGLAETEPHQPRFVPGDEFSRRRHPRPEPPPSRTGRPPLAVVEHPGWESRSSHPEPLQRSVAVLFATLESIDPQTAAHSVRVTGMARRFARHLGLPTQELEVLEITCILHDIGKIAISADVLQKPAPLAPEELAAIKRHPAIGKTLVEMMGFKHQKRLILHHHEHWNGRGYPHGLAGDEIPFLCQVVCLADSYDALISDRPYRQGCTHRQALAEIQASAGTQFSPALSREFIEMFHP